MRKAKMMMAFYGPRQHAVRTAAEGHTINVSALQGGPGGAVGDIPCP